MGRQPTGRWWMSPIFGVVFAAVYGVVESRAIESVPRSSHAWASVTIAAFIILIVISIIREVGRRRAQQTAPREASRAQLEAEIEKLSDTLKYQSGKFGARG